MMQTYSFQGERQIIQFDDNKSVKELIQLAFDEFGYYEPFGMNIVTIFQTHHSKSNTGWFTTDVMKKCAEEIENRDGLCFAYHMPCFFYFAEGGWGHHMYELGNHPVIAEPVSLKIRFDEFDNTVVFAGALTLRKIIRALRKVGYIERDLANVEVHVLAFPKPSYTIHIGINDSMLDEPLTKLNKMLPQDGICTIVL